MPPIPVRMNTQQVLVYELHITNFDVVPLALKRVEVFADDRNGANDEQSERECNEVLRLPHPVEIYAAKEFHSLYQSCLKLDTAEPRRVPGGAPGIGTV